MANLKNIIAGKKIALLGLGAENFALINHLHSLGIRARYHLFDQRSMKELADKYSGLESKGVVFAGIAQKKDAFNAFDLIVRSPGWPIFDKKIKSAQKNGALLTSPMRLFFATCPTRNIIGVTGTKGKGTTASLIAAMLKEAKKKVWLGGNIGIAPFGFIGKIRQSDWVVLELSSFMLEDFDKSPKISVITNFYSEHLAPADPYNPNYHRKIKDYWEAKLNIIRWQKGGNKAILNLKLKPKIKHLQFKGDNFYFSADDPAADSFFINGDLVLLNIQFPAKVNLPGAHNRENVAAAALAAHFAGAKTDEINRAICHFTGLEHRLELVNTVRGVRYYNDSFATVPESAITAINSFDSRIILLAGGADKGSSFKRLAAVIAKKVTLLILLDGNGTPRLKSEVKNAGFPSEKIKTCSSLSSAMAIAAKSAQPGDIVLLSPACASFGMFANYKERGKMFKDEVYKILAK
jgi:UDP-N-acetylmuramoylalanine--D-glutamate ligase